MASNLASVYGEDSATREVLSGSNIQQVPDQALPEQRAPLLSQQNVTDNRLGSNVSESGNRMLNKVLQCFRSMYSIVLRENESFKEAVEILDGTGRLWVVRQGFYIHWLTCLGAFTNLLSVYALGSGLGLITFFLPVVYFLAAVYIGFYYFFNPLVESIKGDMDIGRFSRLMHILHIVFATIALIGFPTKLGFAGLVSLRKGDTVIVFLEIINIMTWILVLAWSFYFWKALRELQS